MGQDKDKVGTVQVHWQECQIDFTYKPVDPNPTKVRYNDAEKAALPG